MRFADFLTVSSVYTNSYIYLGWLGLFIMLSFVLFFPLFYKGLIRKSNPFYISSISILCSLYVFLVFDNMFTFTGVGFQLVYTIVFGKIFNSKLILRGIPNK